MYLKPNLVIVGNKHNYTFSFGCVLSTDLILNV